MLNPITQEIGLILNRLDELARTLDGKCVTPLMSTREAAEFLRCSLSKINQIVDRGLLPYYRVDPEAPKSMRLFHRRDLVAYVLTGRNTQKKPLSAKERKMVDWLL